jgi:hypothetical protein
MQDSNELFSLVWGLFEEREFTDFQTKLQDLDFGELRKLLQITAQSLALESSNSIKFALLLSFKKAILDFAINSYPLLELKPFLVIHFLNHASRICIQWNASVNEFY